MSAFNGKNNIARAVADPQNDHKLPSSKSLAWKAIATPNALAGTVGTHCELVHGDQWNEWKGNHTEHVAKNQTIKVLGKHKETLVESCYQNIIGPHIVQNSNSRNETRMGKFTKVYGWATYHEDHDGDMGWKDNSLEYVNILSFSAVTNQVEVQATHAEGTGVHVELCVVHGEAKAIHAELKGIHFEADGWDNKDKAAEADLSLTNARIAELYVDVVNLFDRTGGPELHTGPSIFAAITGTGVVAP